MNIFYIICYVYFKNYLYEQNLLIISESESFCILKIIRWRKDLADALEPAIFQIRIAKKKCFLRRVLRPIEKIFILTEFAHNFWKWIFLDFKTHTLIICALRVLPAETWLTVYRRRHIRAQAAVGPGWACKKFGPNVFWNCNFSAPRASQDFSSGQTGAIG